MSAGRFIRSRYESNSGDVYSIRIQPETVTTWNDEPTGAVNQQTQARATNSRKLGMNARMVSLKWVGDPPAAPPGYFPFGTLRIPVLTEDAYDLLQKGDVVDYLGSQAEITGFIPERRV